MSILISVVSAKVKTTLAIASIANVVLFVGYRNIANPEGYFPIPAFAISKLYAITLLSLFNSRLRLLGGRYPMRPEVVNIDALLYDGRAGWNWLSRGTRDGTEIRIETETVQQIWPNEQAKPKVRLRLSIC